MEHRRLTTLDFVHMAYPATEYRLDLSGLEFAHTTNPLTSCMKLRRPQQQKFTLIGEFPIDEVGIHKWASAVAGGGRLALWRLKE